MRIIGLGLAAAMLAHIHGAAAAPRPDFASTEAVLQWIGTYRMHPEPARLPAAMRTLARSGAFKDPESAGVPIGFIAGVLAAEQAKAPELLDQLVLLPPEHHWVVVRAVLYSGLPQWKAMLQRYATRMPTRRVMIERALAGQLATLEAVALDSDAALLDTLWGYYFATGSALPVMRIITTLSWSKDEGHGFALPWSKNKFTVEKLTIGSMAKYTLASNAARDVRLLAILKQAQERQPKAIADPLKEVIEAAETVDTARIRREALAAIETYKRKGSTSDRKLSWWGYVGEGAIAVGCIAAAAMGQVQFGLPCVVGGAVSSAALRAWSGAQ